MARRSPVDEKPFRPLDVSILNSVVHHVPEVRSLPESRLKVMGSAPRESENVPGIVRKEPESVPPVRVPTTPIIQRLDQEKRILFTREESQAIDRLVSNLAGRLNAQVKVSHVVRALTVLLLNAEGTIDQRAGESGPLSRPPNGDFAALQRFEKEIACILASAMRDAGLPR